MPKTIEFRHRAREVSRVEAFSDVVFGFAISLLVVSLEAPKNYEEMLHVLHGFLPFAICFFLFISIWFEHHRFYKRYAMHDFPTTILNTILLFVVLFYVYPLKYMSLLMVHSTREQLPLDAAQVLFTVYGVGFTAVFWLFAAMFWRAYSKRDELELNDLEQLDTRESIYDNAFIGMFGIISIALAYVAPRWAGLVYFLIAIPKTIVPWTFGVKRRRIEEAMCHSERSEESPTAGGASLRSA
jgi:uncharacterized membrane protein